MAVACAYTATLHKVKRLVDAGADINAIDSEGRTALMLVVQQFWLPDETEWLISEGARSGIKDVSGKSAFDYLEAAQEDNKADRPPMTEFYGCCRLANEAALKHRVECRGFCFFPVVLLLILQAVRSPGNGLQAFLCDRTSAIDA